MKRRSKTLALVDFAPKALSRSTALAESLDANCITAKSSPDQLLSKAISADAVLLLAPVDVRKISRTKTQFANTPIVVIGRDDSQSAAMEAIRAGADDYLCSQDCSSEILARLKYHLDCPEPVVPALLGADDFVGSSKAIKNIRALISKMSGSNSTVLIRGDTGTGKEIVALMTHRNSLRAKGSLVPINCAAIPEALIEGELFGYEKGSFSGAVQSYPGKFRLAHGGTLFLDEVGELSLAAQAKILRALETGEVFPLGSTRSHKFDVRVIAATNRNLSSEITKGTFRADLFYRLAVIQVAIPPLKDRQEDIVPIAQYLLGRIGEESGHLVPIMTREFTNRLKAYQWPGNVREMRNALEHALVAANCSEILDVHDLPDHLLESCKNEPQPRNTERQILLDALSAAKGKKARAAKNLNCSRMTLYRRLERVGLDNQIIAKAIS